MEELIERVRDGLVRGAYPNERAVSTSIVVPILRSLGWDDSDPEQVLPEHATGRGRVDYALRCPPRPPVAFIEVKGVGRSTDADRQLFEYAFHEGVPLAILTDGREWNFYLPAEQGSYDERRVYQLVLDERGTRESIERLTRYLQRERLASGAAIEAARSDYRDARSRREATDTMPQAWDELLAEPDPMLVEAVLERTEALCGFRPSQEQAVAYLQSRGSGDEAGRARRSRRQLQSAGPVASAESDGSPPQMPGRHSWVVQGRSGTAHRGIDAFAAFLEALFAACPDRRQHMIAAARTRSRNNIATSIPDIYPRQPESADRHHRRLADGLYIGTNLSNATKIQLARQVAGAAGLSYGVDAKLELAER